MSVGLIRLDASRHVRWADAAARAMLSTRQLVGRPLTRWCNGADVERLLDRAAQGRPTQPIDVEMACRGRTRHMHMTARRDEDGRGAAGLWVVLLDLEPTLQREARWRRFSGASHRQAEEQSAALRAANEQLQAEILQRRQTEQVIARLAAIVEDSDDAIVSVTVDGTIVSWNAGAERLYGYAASEIEGCWIGMLVPPDRQARMTALLGRIARGQRVHHYETVRLRKDGTPIDVSLGVSPIRSADGTIIGASMIGRDITLRKRLEAQLAQAQKFELIGQLAAGIAHEINTPIQYIGTNAGFLQRSLESFEKLLRTYELMAEAARVGPVPQDMLIKVDSLVQELDLPYLREESKAAVAQSLDGVRQVAKIVRSVKELSHPGRAEKTPSDLHAILERAITVSRNEWKYVAEVLRGFEAELPPVPCLPDELGQALVNVLVNAAQAIGESVPQGEKGTIRVATRRLAGSVELSIADTGPGIPPEVQSRIFEPFFTTKEIGKGSGQGLAIVRSIVHKHGGHISFTTQPGHGTTFVIRLPLEDMPEHPETPHHATDGAAGR